MTTERVMPGRNMQDYSKRIRIVRLCSMCVVIAGLVLGGLGLIKSETQAFAPDTKPADDPTGPFFARHCQSCHEGPNPDCAPPIGKKSLAHYLNSGFATV